MILDIKCRNIFTFRFDVFEKDSPVAEIDLRMWKEGADVLIKGEEFQVVREKMMSGAFILEAHRTEVVRATKPSVFYRRFNIEFAGRRFVLRAVSAFRRAFVITEEPEDGIAIEIGLIEPTKWYNHSAVARFDDDLPVAVDIFLISLVLMVWKRAANSSS